MLLHEYLHALGFMSEESVRPKAFEVSRDTLGARHPATRIAKDPNALIPDLTYPDAAWRPQELRIELVRGFDRSSVPYIQ